MKPLQGVRIVSVEQFGAGPYATMLLADLGAEVIKVERPIEGDDTRAFAPPYQGDEAAYFLSVNRNKKSITLDMKSEAVEKVIDAIRRVLTKTIVVRWVPMWPTMRS